ncbi:hypothetical protein [Actinopolyspora saharensis]|uniref:hypothetical protein n=1 Tax=Actinopolyspora saharensis TaxID=995062 RepID=UPI003F6666DB
MGDGYRVNMDKLAQLVNDLDRAADDITAANRTLGNATGHDLGSPGIDEASQNFRERWSHSIDKISEGAKATSEALNAARSTYAKLENEVAALITSKVEQAAQQSPDNTGEQTDQGRPSSIEQRLSA